MSASNRIFLLVLPLLAATLAFWFLLLAPKRQDASDLETKIGQLTADVEQQELLAAEAEAARKEFPEAYRRLVVLGKATPEDDDTSSFLIQLQRVADDAGVDFGSLSSEPTGETTAPAPAPEPQTGAQVAESDEQEVENVESGEAPAPAEPPPATEAAAANLPIGAGVGPAGLPIMRYTLEFEGGFFQLADFIAGVDDLVTTRDDGHIGIRGRLVTIDSFELAMVQEDEATSTAPPAAPTGSEASEDSLTATFKITTYLTPPEEGTTGGAAPAGPAPPTTPQPVAAGSSAPPNSTASTTAP
jgi:Tfp pilus assembly protein PilO